LASVIDSLITNAARSIDVPLVKPNCNDDCCELAGQSIVATLVELFNAILEHGYIPPQFLSGIITPVYKKGRDATDFSNYRGITVSCTEKFTF
jgi:hypothetical protein